MYFATLNQLSGELIPSWHVLVWRPVVFVVVFLGLAFISWAIADFLNNEKVSEKYSARWNYAGFEEADMYYCSECGFKSDVKPCTCPQCKAPMRNGDKIIIPKLPVCDPYAWREDLKITYKGDTK